MTRYTPVPGHRGISSYLNADGRKVYRVQVYRGRDWQTGKRRYASRQPIPNLKAAVSWQAEQKDRIRRGDTVEPSMLPLGQWVEHWLASLTSATPKSIITYRDRLAWITAAIGNVPISRVTPAMLEAVYADRLRSGHKAGAIRSAHSTIRTVFQRAVDHSLILRNPAAVARPPSSASPPKPTWTAEQMRQFLAVNGGVPFWGTVWRFMAETWVRVGELAALTWQDVDLDGATVTIQRTVTLAADRTRVTSERAKTQAGRRVIPITAELVTLLRHHRDLQRFCDLIGRNPAQPFQRADGSDALIDKLVFPSPRSGTWLQQPSVQHALNAACDRAGVPRLTPHGLRHTGGSIAYMARIDPKTISERLGHAHVSFTMQVYTHLSEDHHRAASDRIGELLSG